jgi:hypothetical protein
VSLISRNHSAADQAAAQAAAVRDRAVQTAQRAVPAAKNASTTLRQSAENASTTLRQSAEDAAAWAKPKVDDVAAWAKPQVDGARAWAAPRLERSGVAVQETIAPAISEAMVAAARKLDVKPAHKRRRWVTALAITALVAAAASAAAAVALRRRPAEFGYAQDDGPDSMTTSADQPAGPRLAEANGSQPDAAEAEADQHS